MTRRRRRRLRFAMLAYFALATGLAVTWPLVISYTPAWVLAWRAATIVLVAGEIPLFAAFFFFLLSRRPIPGLCPRCYYDLSGVPAGVCPECGAAAGATAAP